MSIRFSMACVLLSVVGCTSANDSASTFNRGPTASPTSYPQPAPAQPPVAVAPPLQPINNLATDSQPTRPPNPFVVVASDPFSTFAADVDTASYDIFRRSVSSGHLPSPSEVRSEEYINYFAYDYPVPDPDSDVPFTISVAASAHVNTSVHTQLVRVGIQGMTPTEQPNANLVFLVDVSGSMAAQNKLPLVKIVLHEALDELNPSDKVSIVSYASDTRVRLTPTLVSDRDRIDKVIDALTAGGSTNGGSGIQLAYTQARAGFMDDGVNHIVLCTDGDFNLGLTSDDELVNLIKRERTSGVTLTALGFGERNNDAMMERVSDAGNGIYSVLYDMDQAIAYAHQRLLSSMIHIAKDMKIQVEFNPEYVYAYRLIGYEDRAVADTQFRNDRVDGGEVGAGHRVTALFELALSEDDLPDGVRASRGESSATKLESEVGADDLLRVSVRWKQPGATTADPAREVATALGAADIAADAQDLDPDARWAVGVAMLAEVLRGSTYVTRNDLTRLDALLTPIAGEHLDRRELLSLLPNVEQLLHVTR